MKTKKIRPVLIDTKEHSDIIYIAETKRLMQRGKLTYNADIFNNLGVNKQLLLISLETEKIEVGDICIALKVDSLEEIDKVCKIKEILSKRSHNYLAEDGWRYSDSYLQKVIATQEQLSPELIQQLIDEYNNGGMKDFEIKMEDWCNYDDDCTWGGLDKPDWRIKLTNGFVTVVEKESILYTEEEVYNLFSRFTEFAEGCKYHLLSIELKNWFEQNKKK